MSVGSGHTLSSVRYKRHDHAHCHESVCLGNKGQCSSWNTNQHKLSVYARRRERVRRYARPCVSNIQLLTSNYMKSMYASLWASFSRESCVLSFSLQTLLIVNAGCPLEQKKTSHGNSSSCPQQTRLCTNFKRPLSHALKRIDDLHKHTYVVRQLTRQNLQDS